MINAYSRSRYQVSVYRTIGLLVSTCFFQGQDLGSVCTSSLSLRSCCFRHYENTPM